MFGGFTGDVLSPGAASWCLLDALPGQRLACCQLAARGTTIAHNACEPCLPGAAQALGC